MKYFSVVLFVVLLTSCKYFDQKPPDENELLNERLNEINWAEVTTYPSFPQCDTVTGKQAKRDCFFSTISLLVKERINVEPIAAMYPDSDTLRLTVTVFPDATIQFFSDSTAINSIKIDSILTSQLQNFPHVEPAQKEGVPVRSRFILPVVLRSSHP